MAVVTPTVPCAAQSIIRLDSDAKLILSDNPFLISGDRRAAAAVEVAAHPEILWSLAPATSLEASATIAHRQYLRRYGGFFNGRAQLRASHRDSEYLSFDTRVAYTRELPADGLTDNAGFTIDAVTRRESYSARASLNWNPDARTSVAASGGWERLGYPDSDLLATTRALSGEIRISRRMSEATSVGLQADATGTSSSAGPSLQAKAFRATLEQRLAAHLTANGHLGLEWSDTGTAGNSERARLVGNGSLCYRPALTEACLSASLQSEISGFGGLQRQLFFGASVRHQLSARSSLVALAGYRSADASLGTGEITALRVSGSYERRLTPVLSIIGATGYLRRQSLSGERNEALVVQVGVTFRGARQ